MALAKPFLLEKKDCYYFLAFSDRQIYVKASVIQWRTPKRRNMCMVGSASR